MGEKLRNKMAVDELKKYFKTIPTNSIMRDESFHIIRHTNIKSSDDVIDVVNLFGPTSLYSIFNDNNHIRCTTTQVAQYVAKLPKNERNRALNQLLEHTEPINAAGIIQIIEQTGIKPDEVLSCLSSKQVKIKKSSQEDLERLKRIANNSFVWRMYDERLLDY
jgi:hypothetical protein